MKTYLIFDSDLWLDRVEQCPAVESGAVEERCWQAGGITGSFVEDAMGNIRLICGINLELNSGRRLLGPFEWCCGTNRYKIWALAFIEYRQLTLLPHEIMTEIRMASQRSVPRELRQLNPLKVLQYDEVARVTDAISAGEYEQGRATGRVEILPAGEKDGPAVSDKLVFQFEGPNLDSVLALYRSIRAVGEGRLAPTLALAN